MKAILMSIRPEWVAKILNGEKTIEIRKKFPKDYVGWVYIYCTSHKNYHKSLYKVCEEDGGGYDVDYYVPSEPDFILNGKVVARFWVDKVECAYNFCEEELCQLACISKEELCKYAGGWYKTDDLLAIHITKVEPFDKPKEIKEFKRWGYDLDCYSSTNGKTHISRALVKLTSAPQSYCYIEV